MTRQPERNETNAARQARLRERRKAKGFRRVTLWLSPEQIKTLETLGGEPWLGRTVKAFLESAVAERARPPFNRQRCLRTLATIAARNRYLITTRRRYGGKRTACIKPGGLGTK